MKTKLPLLTLLLVTLAPETGAVSSFAGPTAGPLASPLAHRRADESVDALIAKGRALLDDGKASEAQAVFESAEKKDGATLKTRMWVLRAWMAQGRINDSLDEIDKLDHAGNKGPAMDYLYGMAFALKAHGYIQDGVKDTSIVMHFTDAVTYLQTATAADPVQFHDAFGPLAEAAYYTQKLDIGRTAAEKAVANRPTDADAVLLLGQIANAQFLVDKDDAAQKARADAEWEAARAAFAKAAELFAARTDATSKSREATARLELARNYGWKQKLDDASREYALAIALDPARVDFREVVNTLSASGPFLACLESAEKAFVKARGNETNLDAAILWWLGWARFQEKQYAPAEEAFAAAVRKWPAFVNSWFYIGHARYQQQKFDEAVAAFKKNWELDPNDIGASIAGNRDFNLSILEFLAGKSFTTGKLADAIAIEEILVLAAPEKDDYWNNLGLFARDAGDQLAQSKKPEDKEKAKALYERSYQAYSKALEIAPEDANYLNDTAVVLHYNLHRDLDKAKALYEKAYANATADLARKDLSPDLRDKRETAQRDSKNNLEKLARGVKKDDE